MNVYGRDDVPAGTIVAVNLSGDGATSGRPVAVQTRVKQGRDATQAAERRPALEFNRCRDGLDVLKWPVIIGFLCVFALGHLAGT